MNLEKIKYKFSIYGIKCDFELFEKITARYTYEIISEVVDDILENEKNLRLINIIFEIKERLKNKQPRQMKTLGIEHKCDFCNNSGFISMTCEDGYDYLFLCNCSLGNQKKIYFPKMAIWNGKKQQTINLMEYVIHHSLEYLFRK